jgi:sulfonate dioxygenase
MAPSATETTTLPTRTAEIPSVKLATNTGAYKELAPVGYEKKAEEEGVEGFKAAKVRGSCAMLGFPPTSYGNTTY